MQAGKVASKPVSDITYNDCFTNTIKKPLHFGFCFQESLPDNHRLSWFFQKLPSLFLKQFTVSTETTKLDKQFHTLTTLLVKK